jgi:NTE family protein
MINIPKILRAFLVDWPKSLLHKFAAGLAKIILGLLAVAGFVIVAFIGLPLLLSALLLFLAFVLGGIVSVNVFVRWFRDDDTVERPQPLPTLTCDDVDVAKVLGPFNAQEGFRYYDAVFEGGGVKAIAQVGALACFDQFGLRPRRVIGTSGGAIVAAFLAAGARPAQMWELLAETDLTQFIDPPWLPNQRWLRRPLYGLVPLASGVLLRKAAVRGRRFEEVVADRLARVTGEGDVTFADLKRRTGIDLEVVATDITRRRALVLPGDIKDFEGWMDRDPLELPVARAVRMSMALPFIFEPVRLKLASDGTPMDIVDGGVSSNYPIWRFDTNSPNGPSCPTFGFLLDEQLGKAQVASKPTRFVFDYAFNVIQSGVGAIDRIQNAHNEARTIRLPTYGVGTSEFDLAQSMQAQLFEGGFTATCDRLRDFKWAEYVGEFRGGRARVPQGASVPAQFTGQASFDFDGVTYTVE